MKSCLEDFCRSYKDKPADAVHLLVVGELTPNVGRDAERWSDHGGSGAVTLLRRTSVGTIGLPKYVRRSLHIESVSMELKVLIFVRFLRRFLFQLESSCSSCSELWYNMGGQLLLGIIIAVFISLFYYIEVFSHDRN